MVVVFGSLVALLHLVLNNAFTVPMLHPDEGGYLGNARQIVEHVGSSSEGYLAGYSLLLVLPASLASDPWLFYSYALDVNAVLAGMTAGLLVVVFRGVFPKQSMLLALVAASFASFVSGIFIVRNFALGDNLLILLIVLASLLLLRSTLSVTKLRRRLLLGAFGAVCALSTWVNPRGVAVVVSGVVVVAAFALVENRKRLVDIAIVLVVAGFVFLLGRTINGLILGATSTAPGGSASLYLDAFLQAERWSGVFVNIVRRVGYLSVASVGGIWAVMIWAVRSRRAEHRTDSDSGALSIVVFLFVAIGISLVFNSFTMGFGEDARVDHLFYGRYLEVYLPVLVVLAVGVAASSMSAADSRVVALISATSGFIAAIALSLEPLDGPAIFTNVSSVWVFSVFTNSNLVLAFFLGGFLTALTWIAVSIRPRLGLAWMGAALVGMSVTMYLALLSSASPFGAQVEIPRALIEINSQDREECVSLLPRADAEFIAHQYNFLVPGIVLEESSSPTCSLRVGSRIQHAADMDSDLLVKETIGDLYLWRTTGLSR